MKRILHELFDKAWKAFRDENPQLYAENEGLIDALYLSFMGVIWSGDLDD